VPDEFAFSVKLPKEITHVKALKNCAEDIERFAEETTGLGGKFHVVLVQLPPRLVFQEPDAAAVFEHLRSLLTAPLICEPRHPSWFSPAAEAFLRQRGVGRAAVDSAPVPDAAEPGAAMEIIYVRLHGSQRMYYSDHDADALARIHVKLRAYSAHASEVLCIFDNGCLCRYCQRVVAHGNGETNPVITRTFTAELQQSLD
jgi:uncharacterized protein YecE (DUF72 family)